MAPEQLEGHKPGPKTDIYSLAVVAFETLFWHARATRAAPRSRSPTARLPTRRLARRGVARRPAGAAELLARAMGPDPEASPETATALVDELQLMLGAEAPSTEPLQQPCRAARARARPGCRARAPPRAPAPRARRRPPPAVRRSPAAARGSLPARRCSWRSPSPRGSCCSRAAMTPRSGDADGSEEMQAAEEEPAGRASRRGQQSGAPATTSRTRSLPRPPTRSPRPAPATYEVPVGCRRQRRRGPAPERRGQGPQRPGDYDAAIPVLERAVRSFPAGPPPRAT